MKPTATLNNQSQRLADFNTLIDALEYAATGETGYNFYDANGNLQTVLPYAEVWKRAQDMAKRLLNTGAKRGDSVAIIADTDPDFVVLFFACRFAGLVPFALPIPVNLGSHQVYVGQLQGMLNTSKAAVALAGKYFINFLEEAAQGIEGLKWTGTPEELSALPQAQVELQRNATDEVAYLQFTSGSTRNPQAVIITEHAVMKNLQGICRYGLKMHPADRCASWLPFYHDMGLVGFILAPMVAQLSVDFLRTRDFAVRPIQWLRLISRNRCTLAFSQTFGFKLCSLRVRKADLEGLDLSCWRAAGVGAEMIRPEILRTFAHKFAEAGFSPNAFLPCYGLAEATLAVSFSELGKGFQSITIDTAAMTERGVAVRLEVKDRKHIEFVNCGTSMPGHQVKIVNNEGEILPDLRVGRVLTQGQNLMSGYLNNAEATNRSMYPDNWLDTGDLGFLLDGNLYITGRSTDVIIINGRNIRAQDIEELTEHEPAIKSRESSAFGINGEDGTTMVVLVIECRLTSVSEKQALINRLQQQIYKAFGIRCFIELVPHHTLPRTSSGKLSRTAARIGFLERNHLESFTYTPPSVSKDI